MIHVTMTPAVYVLRVCEGEAGQPNPPFVGSATVQARLDRVAEILGLTMGVPWTLESREAVRVALEAHGFRFAVWDRMDPDGVPRRVMRRVS